MATYVLVAVSWDKTVDRICRLMDCREDFVKFLEKNIHPLFVIILYSSLKITFKGPERSNDQSFNLLGCEVNLWNLFYGINWTVLTLKCQC